MTNPFVVKAAAIVMLCLGVAYAHPLAGQIPSDTWSGTVVRVLLDLSSGECGKSDSDQCQQHHRDQLQNAINEQGRAGYEFVQLVPGAEVYQSKENSQGGVVVVALFFRKLNPARGDALQALAKTLQDSIGDLRSRVARHRADLLALLRGSLADVFGAMAYKELTAQVRQQIVAELDARIVAKSDSLQKQIDAIRQRAP